MTAIHTRQPLSVSEQVRIDVVHTLSRPTGRSGR